jgi:transcriptional regulator with XRE-family HTH domain
MRVSRAHAAIPLPVRRDLKKLGADISAARRRRGITAALLSERAFIDRKSLARVERGEAGVSMGIYASVLFALGLADRLANVADIAHDPLGRALADEQLPKRVRTRRDLGADASDGT